MNATRWRCLRSSLKYSDGTSNGRWFKGGWWSVWYWCRCAKLGAGDAGHSRWERRAYVVPASVHMHKFGCLCYVGLTEEVKEQEVVLDRVIRIYTSAAVEQTHTQVKGGCTKNGETHWVKAREKRLRDSYQSRLCIPDLRWAQPWKNQVTRSSAQAEVMVADPVYERKSTQGMIGLVKKFLPDGLKILYAHLAGAPAINGCNYTYRSGWHLKWLVSDRHCCCTKRHWWQFCATAC